MKVPKRSARTLLVGTLFDGQTKVVSTGARYIVHRYTVATCHLCLSSCSLDDPDLSPIAVSLDLKRLLQVEDGWDCSLACSRSGVVIDVPITIWSFHNYID